MASYYYLIASLPELSAEGDMPITYDEFLDMCSTTISESKYKLLENLTLSSCDGPLMKEWQAFYGNLMCEVNRQRSSILGRQYDREYEQEYENTRIASNAIAAKNPLEAEKLLLSYQFEKLDSLVGLHSFDDTVLFGYAIKLKLLERQSCFVQKKGKEEFETLFKTIQQRVYTL